MFGLGCLFSASGDWTIVERRRRDGCSRSGRCGTRTRLDRGACRLLWTRRWSMECVGRHQRHLRWFDGRGFLVLIGAALLLERLLPSGGEEKHVQEYANDDADEN